MRSPWQVFVVLMGLSALPADVRAAGPPPWLPRYDLSIRLDVAGHVAHVKQRVTWSNRHARPSDELVFNAHSHYQIPDGDIGFLAKMLELLRQYPSEGMDFNGPPLHVQKVTAADGAELPFRYRDDNVTALAVALPRPVAQGESVTVELEFVFNLPPKQGRWGQWKGVTYLAQWLPVLAVYEECGWQPTPFIPWHQPFYNEAGNYTARVTLPCEQKVACTGSIVASSDLGDGWKQLDIAAPGVRDFAFVCSACFEEHVGVAVIGGGVPDVKVRCVALPEHAYYAREIVRWVSEAIPVYNRWFGPYPYPEFVVAESFFAWNGNECGGLIMIDERVFAMPHLGVPFVEYLVSHELCHQWWYNLIGTNGYCETWMDEGFATYFSHRLMDAKHGRNNALLKFPALLEWLPNIYRNNYRNYSLYGALGRGDNFPVVQEMPKFQHTVNLLSMCYDKGSRIVGIIEDQMGEAAFLDFMHLLYRQYQYRILRVADLRRELEAYTGRSWEDFFQNWLYGSGLCDWCVEKVTVAPCPSNPVTGGGKHYKATVLLHQKGDIDEATCVGFCLDGGDGFQVRVPVQPHAGKLEFNDPPATMETLPDHRVRVEVVLPAKPTQIAVDPDQVLVDREPANNYWKPRVRVRLTPLYTMLDDTDITCAYDRWNVTAGPWFFGTAYDDPWYTRSTMFGLRVGAYRTQQFFGGAYVGYRTDYRDVVAGLDGVWDHWPYAHAQVGFNVERRLATVSNGERDVDRGVIWGRHVFQYGSSLYLPPMDYLEVFGDVADNFLPFARNSVAGAERFNRTSTAGVHYHKNYLTPYWDAEGGYQLDVTYAGGMAMLGKDESFQQVSSQFSVVKGLPDWLGPLSATRLAARVYGGAGFPSRGQFFSLGGEKLLRGFDLAERQGNAVWLASLEWRVPLAKGLTWDVCDHSLGLRNVYGAAFYDVGDIYSNGHTLGPVAHSFGGGLRFDVAWFSLIERTILRMEVAKTVNASSPVQFWFGVQHPF